MNSLGEKEMRRNFYRNISKFYLILSAFGLRRLPKSPRLRKSEKLKIFFGTYLRLIFIIPSSLIFVMSLFIGLAQVIRPVHAQTFNSSKPVSVGESNYLATREIYPQKAFTDITEQSGVGHEHHKPQLDSKLSNIMPWMASVGAAVAAGDYDNDGDIDLYVTNSQKGYKNALYRNDGNLTFSEVGEAASVAWVNEEKGGSMDAIFFDYDNDGNLDLYVVKWGTNVFFRNNGDGTFTDITDAAGVADTGNGNAAVAFDYNQDGFLDILIGNYFRTGDLWHLEDTRIMHDDFEKARNAGANVLYKNNGDGTFTNVAEMAGVADTGWTLDVGCADYDNDGDLDVYFANDFGQDKLYRNNGDGTFTDVTMESIGVDTKKGMNAEFGDYDNDGYLDIYVTNIMTQEYLMEGNIFYRNNGDGTFVDISRETQTLDGGWGWCAKFLDYDNDGDLDIYEVNGFVSAGAEEYWFDLATTVSIPEFDSSNAQNWPVMGNKSLSGYEPSRLFRNEGNDIFTDVAALAGVEDYRRDGRGIAVADFDNDGDLDMYVVNQGAKAVLYRNDIGNRNHWMLLKLIGTKSNREAVGARIKLTAGDLSQIREVDPGNGYASQSDRRVHFGLGHQEKIDRIEIRWPSGSTQVLTDMPVNQIITIVEGEH